jgi:hypothetical protein
MATSSSSGGLITADSVFGLTLTTYRDEWDPPPSSYGESKDGASVVPYFPYECLTAAISVAFFRMTIKSRPDEPLLLRLFFSVTLASMAYLKQPYAMIGAIELFSFIVPHLLLTANVSDVLHRLGWLSQSPSKQSSSSSSSSTTTTAVTTLVRLLLIAVSAMGSLIVSHVLHSDLFVPMLQAWTPTVIQSIVLYMIPIAEMQQAYDTIALFVDRRVLHQQFATLLFVTFHVQFGMGHLGIDFLTREQTRRNDLVRLDMSPESNPDQHPPQQQQQHSKEEGKDDNGDDHGDDGYNTATTKTDENDDGLAKNHNGTGNKTENGNAPYAAAAEADEDHKIHSQSTSPVTSTTTTATTQQPQTNMPNETSSTSNSTNSNSNSSSKRRIQRQLTAAKRFQKSAAPFILFAATPYMLQMIVFGNINFFAYTCFENEVIRAVRLDQVFAHDSHLVALSKDAAATSPNGT